MENHLCTLLNAGKHEQNNGIYSVFQEMDKCYRGKTICIDNLGLLGICFEFWPLYTRQICEKYHTHKKYYRDPTFQIERFLVECNTRLDVREYLNYPIGVERYKMLKKLIYTTPEFTLARRFEADWRLLHFPVIAELLATNVGAVWDYVESHNIRFFDCDNLILPGKIDATIRNLLDDDRFKNIRLLQELPAYEYFHPMLATVLNYITGVPIDLDYQVVPGFFYDREYVQQFLVSDESWQLLPLDDRFREEFDEVPGAEEIRSAMRRREMNALLYEAVSRLQPDEIDQEFAELYFSLDPVKLFKCIQPYLTMDMILLYVEDDLRYISKIENMELLDELSKTHCLGFCMSARMNAAYNRRKIKSARSSFSSP
jgi:hypothetical protein